jgi:hypothetical protein
MAHKVKVALCSEIRKKHTMQSQNHVEFFNTNPGGT